MKNNVFMCVMIGCVLLSLPTALWGQLDLKPSGCESTALKDGFQGNVKRVKVFVANQRLTYLGEKPDCSPENRELKYVFRYDSLGRRVECHDIERHIAYQTGYDRRGNRVRASVICDTLKERMRDTVFIYDRDGKMTSKRISFWGELMESEQYRYDSLGRMVERKLFSQTGVPTQIQREIFEYDHISRLLFHGIYDKDNYPTYQKETIYNPKTGRILEEQEVSNGVLTLKRRYSYDVYGRLAYMDDESKGEKKALCTKYKYLHDDLVEEIVYDVDGDVVGRKKYSYKISGVLSQTEEERTVLSSQVGEKKKYDWEKKTISYTQEGKIKEELKYVGSGSHNHGYDRFVHYLLSDGTLILPEDCGDEESPDSCGGLKIIQKVMLDIPYIELVAKPIDYKKYDYDSKGRCVRWIQSEYYMGDRDKDVRTKYNRNGQPLSSQTTTRGTVCCKESYEYDKQSNLIKHVGWRRLPEYPVYRFPFSDMAMQCPPPLAGPGYLYDLGAYEITTCQYDYWK